MVEGVISMLAVFLAYSVVLFSEYYVAYLKSLLRLVANTVLTHGAVT